MPIGTSNGDHFEDQFDMTASQFDAPITQNNVSPSDPNDMTGQFNTPLTPEQQTDYNTKFSWMSQDSLDLFQQISSLNNQAEHLMKKPNLSEFEVAKIKKLQKDAAKLQSEFQRNE